MTYLWMFVLQRQSGGQALDMVAESMESWYLASEAYGAAGEDAAGSGPGAAAFGASLAALIVAPQTTHGAAAVMPREVMVR